MIYHKYIFDFKNLVSQMSIRGPSPPMIFDFFYMKKIKMIGFSWKLIHFILGIDRKNFFETEVAY